MRYLPLLSCLALPVGLCAPPSAKEAVEQSWDAEHLLDESRFEAAIRTYAASIPSLTATLGEAAPRTLIAINNYATALLQMNRGAEAETALRDALDRRQRAGPGEDQILAATWNNLGEALVLAGRFKAAVVVHERALALRQRLNPDLHPEIASSLNNLAEALRQAGELTRARLLFNQAADIWAGPAKGKTGAAAVPMMPGYARTKNSLGLLYDTEQKRPEAEEAYTQALQASLQAYGPAHEYTATLHYNLAAHYFLFNDWSRAEKHCRQALDVFELRPAFHDEQLAEALQLHADILERLRGRKREAKAQRQRAGAMLSLQ
ncbi:MAG: tetratricopeptide repeat protein [Acidobacteriota bacterium]